VWSRCAARGVGTPCESSSGRPSTWRSCSAVPPLALVERLADGRDAAAGHDHVHFEVTIRIQVDRDHRVCSDGPYRLVRHPGYAFGLLALWSVPLLLGPLLAAWPTLGATGVIVARTAFEDATLHAELDGYAAYTQGLRHRLLPGVW
jgi:hypothetical protein